MHTVFILKNKWKRLLLLASFLMLSLGSPLHGYEAWTHQWIASKALQRVLIPITLVDPDLVGYIGTYNPIAPPADPADASDGTTILEGAVEEDYISTSEPLNHFWLPDRSYRDGLPFALCTSAEEKAQELYSQALIEYCKGNKARGCWYFGRVMHLVTDMACPAHVHKDIHLNFEWATLDFDTYEKLCAQSPVAGKPNHEIFAGLSPVVPPLPMAYPPSTLPPYPFPGSHNLWLGVKMFEMATWTRRFDSDDSGYYGHEASTADNGIYNSFTFAIPIDHSGLKMLPTDYGDTTSLRIPGCRVFLFKYGFWTGLDWGAGFQELVAGRDFEFDFFMPGTVANYLFFLSACPAGFRHPRDPE